jgi:hypothetical protein
MKKINHYAFALLGIAIILFLWKIFHNQSPEKPPMSFTETVKDGKQDKSRIAENHHRENILKTPKGNLRFADVKPSYDMVNHFIDLGLIDEDYQKRLSRLRPNPWKVFLDENNHAIKFQIREVVIPTVNNDIAGMNKIEQSYLITEYGTNQISMNDKVMMKNLYLSLQVYNSFLDNATEESSKSFGTKEVEMYPVMAQYQGHPAPELRASDKNLDYLSGKNLPMILIKSNKGIPQDDDWSTASEEGQKILSKYGMEECVEIEWLLWPFPRNKEEAQFFASAPIPEHIGTGAIGYTPTVAAWERVHGKKYVDK